MIINRIKSILKGKNLALINIIKDIMILVHLKQAMIQLISLIKFRIKDLTRVNTNINHVLVNFMEKHNMDQNMSKKK